MSADPTFVAFTASQAAAYAQNRGGAYPSPLYDAILDYHSGATCLLLDVGTGPGKSLFDLVPTHFARGVGCDASVEMIAEARREAAKRSLQGTADFAVAGGEVCDEPLSGQKADCVTVAMAAHWFDMAQFYTAAARALRTGGTLAIFTASSTYVHPSTPNAAAIQQVLFDLEDGELAPYAKPGNLLTRHAYDALPLPWQLDAGRGLFDETAFRRVDWDRDGVPSAPAAADGTPGPFLADGEVTVGAFVDAVGSASMVIRWREAHPELALGERDPVVVTARRLREANGGREEVRLAQSFTLLLMRRAEPRA